MASTARLNPAFLAPFALCVAVLGGWTVYKESAEVVSEPGLTYIQRVVQSLGDEEIGGLWTRTQRSELLSCANALMHNRSLEMRYLPEETQAALAPHCQQTALSAVAAYPTNSYAWSVSALAASQLGDWTGMNDALVRSQLTGPTEQWVAELRVVVAQDNYAMLDEAARAVTEKDLRLLLVSIPGIRAIADRYVDDVDFRARVEAVVETMPPETQRRFVSVVRREITG